MSAVGRVTGSRLPRRRERFVRGAGRPAVACLSLLGLVIVLAIGFMRALPPFEGPDAAAHLQYVAYLRERPRLPPRDAATVARSHELVQQPPLYYALAAVVTAPRPLSATLALHVPLPDTGGLTHRVTATPPGPSGADMVPLRLAAAVSLLGGLLTVVATWLLARALFPAEPLVALLAAAAVGMNPQFLASSVTVSNDSWAAATAAWTVWLGVRSAGRPRRARGWAAVGVAAGLAALTKYGNLAVVLALWPLWALALLRAGRGVALRATVVAGVAFFAVAGWWYGLQLAHHGSPVPVSSMVRLLPELARESPAPLERVLREAAWLPRSYVGVFGHGALAPPAFFRLAFGLALAAGVGLAVRATRAVWRRERRAAAALALPAFWAAVVLVSLLSWMRLMTVANQGRLLFPAAPAIGLLLAAGWTGLAPRRRQGAATGAALAGVGTLALWGLLVVADAYAVPRPLHPSPAMDRRVDAGFQGGMRLLGVDLPRGAAAVSGGRLPLTLYWSADQEIEQAYALFVHVADRSDRLLAGFDGYPAGGRHPTRQWRPDVIFADSYALAVATVTTDTLGMLSIGFYDRATGERRAVRDAAGRPSGDRVVVGPVRVLARPPAGPPAAAPLAEWCNGVTLDTARLRLVGGAPRDLEVVWRARKPVQRDYTVFAQLLDARGRLLCQVDQQPQAGAWPSSTWVPGYAVRDTYRLPCAAVSSEPSAPLPAERLILGLYDDQGARLTLGKTCDEPEGDHVVVWSRPR